MVAVVSAALALAGCAGTRPSSQPQSKAAPAATAPDESFDPLTLQDDDLQFPAEPAVQPARQPEQASPSTTESAPENVQIDGFRVQLFATKDYENALVVRKEAEFVFIDYGHNVYVEFDAPYYKVRVGDCKTREEAEALRELARKNGYPSAWIVKTKVWSNPPAPEAASKPPDSN